MLVDQDSPPRAAAAPRAETAARSNAARGAGLLVALAVLLAVAAASIAIGAKDIPPHEVWHGLFHYAGSDDDVVVRKLRLPRTLLGLLVGAALGVAGAAMQALTRNPLADPGLLGVNAGAAAAVVTAISFLGVTSPTAYVWCALAGAAAVSVLVYAIGGSRSATPVRLALAGTAVTALLQGWSSAVQLTDSVALDRMRFWQVGSLASADMATVRRIAPFLLVGAVLAFAAARPLNAIALGDDTARGLGARLTSTRVTVMAAITLLCGAATAACGPIVFVGLMVPHVVRGITGPDMRWILPYAAVLSPVLLLGSDVLGRLLTRPAELQVGIVTAVLGGPVFIALVRRRKTAEL
ncbi:FecCD family ABC transporter permease [Actinacidiphila epipremni]|uniref:Iron chelate uptake ABC transporter family permease subunit n=1 Tax=Actinacidiphila epipremni TaxID=2053013 RepID=A0ABX0ZWF6_9ACTN|nr:iron chelate uptake ABC transporter family permease subunit [Actinacidiphila epipremni]NJP47511.1 iron chelate uptake ABC transporter family permease subunit [Actinacidiphila epipremni]